MGAMGAIGLRVQQMAQSLADRVGNVVREQRERLRRDGVGPTALAAGRGALFALRRASIGLLAGLIGSLAAVIVMILLRLWWGAPTAPELVGERILPLLTTGQFLTLLVQFGPNAKTEPLGLALLGQLIVGILIGPGYELAARVPGRAAGFWPPRRAWIVAGILALAMELLAVILFWPVLPENVFGNPIDAARLITVLALLLTFATYAAVLALASHWLRRAWGAWAGGYAAVPSTPGIVDATPASGAISRRAVLSTAGAAVIVVATGAFAINRLITAYLGRSNLAYEGNGTPASVLSAITPNEDFYVVSKNLLDPTVIVGQWQLELTGLVHTAKTWSYDELRRLPSETRAVTLECISNQVGGHLLSTAVWEGVPLQTLLNAAGGVGSAAGKRVIFYSVDGYTTSLPLSDLLEARTLLAWQMNGAPLPDRHGFPLRAIVPGRYGEQSAKWLTRIEITDHGYKGFYQSQGWSDAPLETISRIDLPHGQIARDTISVMGIAFAGIRGIQKVEVSADGGATWNTATLTPPLSDQSWVFWRWIWQPAAPGMYTLVARATDGTGTAQTATQRFTVPDGATGWHSVKVTVK